MTHRLIATLALALVANACLAADWAGFRGPHGNGIATEDALPTAWGPEKNIKWKVALPRPANGSPIVSNGRVFVTSAEDTEGKQRSLYCFDRKTGEQLWVKTVEFAKKMPTHKTNPYSGSTPAADGERVLVWHASAGLYCYDFEGKELWSREFGDFKHIWGYGTSPVIYGDQVIMHCGPGERVFLTALELATGKTVWEAEESHEGNGSEREDGKYMGSWCTPIVATVAGQDQIICTMPQRVVAYDPADGSEIWSCEGIRHGNGDLAYSSPIIADDLCVAIGGYRGPSLAVKLGGKGDVTATHRVWRHEGQPQSIGSGVYLDGYIYRPNAGPGTIECLDPKTGEIVWSQRAGSYWGSVIFAAGHCFATNQDGTTIVFKPSPDGCEVVARNALEEPCNSTPAVSDGEIFIRTHRNLYCIGE